LEDILAEYTPHALGSHAEKKTNAQCRSVCHYHISLDGKRDDSHNYDNKSIWILKRMIQKMQRIELGQDTRLGFTYE
jgi:hypothetical protein